LEYDQLFQYIKADLSRHRPHTTETARPSTPVEVILRLLVVQYLYAWSYAQTEHLVGDSLPRRRADDDEQPRELANAVVSPR
jgi:IS5 family transposase